MEQDGQHELGANIPSELLPHDKNIYEALQEGGNCCIEVRDPYEFVVYMDSLSDEFTNL